MIDFREDHITYRNFTAEELAEERGYYAQLITEVKRAMSGIGASKYALGLELKRLYESDVYCTDPGWVSPCKSDDGTISCYLCSYVFFRECEKNFDLDKSQVSRYMNIVDEFGDGENGLKQEWSAYSWSQLVELLPLTPEERKEITPEMTIKAIRAYKEKLVATSQQEKSSGKADEIAVATSQQKDYWIKSVNFPANSGMQYLRFIGCSVKYVCDQVLQAEAKIAELKQKLADLEALSAPKSDESGEINYQ